MKLKKCILIVIVFLFATAFFTYSGEEDALTIDNTAFDCPQRTAATFDHDGHNEKAELEDDCTICHHVYEEGKLVEEESSEDSSCSECHTLKKSADNSIPLRMAYHKRCKECHFDSKKGPVLCGECHVK
jgi:hypothetical protein